MTPKTREMTPNEALELGMRQLTTEYFLPREQTMLDNVLADMRRGGIFHAIVDLGRGPTVWRGYDAKGRAFIGGS